MSDLEGQVSLPTGSAEQDAAKVEKGFKKIAEAARLAKRESIDYQREAARFFKGMQSHGESAAHSMHQLRHSIRFVGEQLEIGGITGSRGIAGALSMTGGFARLAAGAAVAAVAVRALTAVYDAQMDRLELAQKHAESYTAAVREGSQEIEKQARAGMNQEGDIRRLVGRGGDIGYANRYAKANGLPLADAQRAVAGSQILPEAIQSLALQSAGAFARSGEGTAAEGMQMIGRNPLLRARLRISMNDYSNSDDFVAAAAGRRDEVTGRLIASARGTHYNPHLASEVASNIDSSNYLSQADLIHGVMTTGAVREQNYVSSGTALAATQRVEGQASDPIGARIAELTRVNMEQLAYMKKRADLEQAMFGSSAEMVALLRILAGGDGKTERVKYLRSLDKLGTVGGG